MKRSIKLFSKGASLADIGSLLVKYEIPVSEGESISTGQPGDKFYYVSFICFQYGEDLLISSARG